MEPDSFTPEQMNAVYLERNRCVLLALRLALAAGYVAGIGQDEQGEPGWQHILYIDLPSGQVSWHVPDQFVTEHCGNLPVYTRAWDGHDTEEKYRRVLAYRAPVASEHQPPGEPPMGSLKRDELGYSPARPWRSELFHEQRRRMAAEGEGWHE
jgi:hypothetical protein